MIPLHDLNPTRTRSVVTWGIIGINVAVFLLTWNDLQDAARRFGAVAYHFTGATPERVTVPGQSGLPHVLEPVPKTGLWPLRAITHMWVHGSVLHILGNMWFLHVFGDNVEESLGRLRYALLYVGAGFVALTLQVVSDPASGVPMVGASGAIAGILGAYLRLFPHARVLTLVPIGFILTTFIWPAGVFLGIWIAMQVISAAMSHGTAGGVAWYAHIGGFALGWLLAKTLARPTRPARVEVEIDGRRLRGRNRFDR